MTPSIGESAQEIAARYGAIAPAGLRVTVCPPATFSEGAFDVVPLRDRHAREMEQRAQASKAQAARRKRVRALADGTRSIAEIAEICGVEANTLNNDLVELRKAGHRVEVTRAGVPSMRAAEPRLRKMFAAGKTDAEMAETIGCSERTITAWRKKLRLARCGAPVFEAVCREHGPAIAEMAARGMSDVEIGKALGRNRRQICSV